MLFRSWESDPQEQPRGAGLSGGVKNSVLPERSGEEENNTDGRPRGDDIRDEVWQEIAVPDPGNEEGFVPEPDEGEDAGPEGGEDSMPEDREELQPEEPEEGGAEPQPEESEEGGEEPQPEPEVTEPEGGEEPQPEPEKSGIVVPEESQPEPEMVVPEESQPVPGEPEMVVPEESLPMPEEPQPALEETGLESWTVTQAADPACVPEAESAQAGSGGREPWNSGQDKIHREDAGLPEKKVEWEELVTE